VADSVRSQLEADLKVAMKAGDLTARETIRFTLAALKNAEIDKRGSLSQQEELAILKTQLKRRLDSIEQYQSAGRSDLVERESRQLDVLNRYMPAELSDADLQALVASVIAEVGATGPREMGKVMPVAIQRAGDHVSGKRLSDAVRAALARPG
jgi:uncharacterized protein